MTALKVNRPKKYSPIESVEEAIAIMHYAIIYRKRKEVFRLRTVSINVDAVFVNYDENRILHYQYLNDYLNEKPKKKINKVSLHRIISIKTL